MLKSRQFFFIGVTLLLLAVMFPIVFIKLESFSLRLWDESMFAMNTYDMIQHKAWLVQTMNGIPDAWNSKPPLFNWVQILFVKLGGFNELSLRLPSAIAAAITMIIVFWYAHRKKGILYGTFAFLILLTSYGFVTYHSARTGDSDELMGLFLLVANLQFIELITSEKIPPGRIYLFFFSLLLAFWTKSLQAFLFFPAYLILIIYFKENRNLLIKNKHFWIGAFSLFFGCILFLALREGAQPGYLSLFFGSDAGRFFKKVDDHNEPFIYFFELLLLHRFSFWFVLFVIGSVIILGDKTRRKENSFLIAAVIMAASYLLIVSISTTKVPWYDVPLYPMMALISGYVIYQLVSTLNNQRIGIITASLLFVLPYINIYGRSNSNSYTPFEEKNESKERYLFNLFKDRKSADGLKLYHPHFDRSLMFYQVKFSERGEKISIIKDLSLSPGDRILFSSIDDSTVNRLKASYVYTIEDSTEFIQLLKIDSKR